MAVVATLSKGYDLDYMWRQATADPAKEVAGYYLQATEGGEPAGRWWGPGAEALGFARGQVVEREPYDLLFGHRQAPDGTPLGRPPGGKLKAAEVYARLLAAEPHATAERRHELRIEAAQQARQSPLYFDLTVSLSKSVSIFHASLGENARQAHLAGDQAGEAYWSALVTEMDQMIYQAVWAGFDYLQREAAYTRTGSHASRVDGRETGQWHEAELAVAHWLQHTSRDGDMQLHVHSQIAHTAKTVMDGKWRAPDSYGYNEHIGAVAAVVSQHLEEALTRRFGLEWTARDDGHGFEIKGISGEMMRLFSSRRESITQEVRARAARFEQARGRKPSQRELAQIAQASNFATRAAKDGALDFAQLHADWADKLARTLGVPLASVAPSVWGNGGAGGRTQSGSGDPGPGLSPLELARAAQKAVALAQQEKSTWTRADLVKYLGRVLPRTGLDPAAAAARLEDLADRALGSEFEPVVCLEAPEAVEVPRSLLRVDGRSVYQRHGGIKYATRVQLSMEEKMVAQAQADMAPALTREHAARLLGTEVTQLEAAMLRRAQAARIVDTQAQDTPDAQAPIQDAQADDAARHAQGTQTQPGSPRGALRGDLAAALFCVLTDGQRVSVINAPAGSGKTRVLTEAGRMWTAAGMGRVVGITPSQSSRNTLAAGVAECYNTAQFLGHLPGQRGARGQVGLRPGDLVLMDEASMASTPDLADVIGQAAASGAKVILAGDAQQLQAVESGGGMSLLASVVGYVQLAEPVRFRAGWERAASLGLRAGDISVLAGYDQHGRIKGGDPEQMMDAAASAYVALTLAGKDTLLMAADHARRQELSRRIRDDLVHLGLVDDGPSVGIADGDRASAGDLIVCTRNDHTVGAGEPGRTLANGDLLRIEAVTGRGLLVRRALDADPQTGQRRWTERKFLYRGYRNSELGYAVTDHVAQSRTVHTGLALITGTEDRQHAYVALSRGTDRNVAFVFTVPPKLADPAPGSRPAPELARHDKITAQREGQPTTPPKPARESEALGVLAAVLERDGQELSASETRQRNLSNADHLAILNAIWTGETAAAREQRYRDLLATALPAEYRGEASHQAKWLWRTLRAAELAGLDAGQVLTGAIGERDLAGSRDVPSVVDARLRARVNPPVPQPAGPWSAQVPDIADPGRRVFVTEVAAMMDARKERIGEHAAEHALPWAVNALGPVPEHPLDRLDWQRRASAIGAYRELYGYGHPTEPIGPEPAGDAPDKRAAWYEAFAALGPADGPDVRRLADGSLLHMRDTYPVETAWAPKWVGDELRQVRGGAEEAHLAAIRADAEAAAAKSRAQAGLAAQHEVLAASYRAMHDAYRERESVFAAVMDDRGAWEKATAQQRRLAVAADAELRRRHPDQRFEPLRSAEPEPVTEAQRDELTLTAGEDVQEMGQWIKDLAAQRREFAGRLAERESVTIPAEDPDYGDLGQAFPAWPEPGKDAILQPPKPPIKPAARVLEAAAEPDNSPEAGA
jgi:conjugative relaxase-like TrwC/TraI family protein